MKRKKLQKQRKVIILSLFILLISLSAGYAAFSTNIDINAKGNIKTEYVTFGNITVPLSKNNDGLYQDEYENDRYIYKGNNPNNYITFNNEEYRIIAIEKDKTIKIIKNTAITDKINYDNDEGRVYNTEYYTTRYNKNGYCTKTYGCNWWASNKNTYDITNTITNTVTINNETLELPEEDSLANQYLNSTGQFQNNGYYSTLGETSKNQIKTHYFNIGGTDSDNIQTVINDEEKYKWQGNIGLANASDYLKSQKNSGTYMTSIYKWYWFITPALNTREQMISSSNKYNMGGTVYWGIGSNVGIVPVIYLNENLTIIGKGEKTNPYQIK